MGADLYIQKINSRRDYFDNEGYFRDSYNPYNLLWEFNLSYWKDIEFMLDKEGNMSVDKAKELLKIMKEREDIFEKNLNALLEERNPYWDFETDLKTNRKRWKPNKDLSKVRRLKLVSEWRMVYDNFKKFLNRAIKMNSPIECSI